MVISVLIGVNNETLEVMEWDECLPDCPSQAPEYVCQEDPIFPQLVYGGGPNKNYTTDYDPDAAMVTSEVRLTV